MFPFVSNDVIVLLESAHLYYGDAKETELKRQILVGFDAGTWEMCNSVVMSLCIL